MNLTQVLDYRGLTCPEPVIRLHALLKMHKPERLEILVDNEASQENLTRAFAHYGYTTENTCDGAVWHLHAQCTDPTKMPVASPTGAHAKSSTEGHAETNQSSAQAKKTLILITTETLGLGDTLLGTRLMESFLATLPEMGDELWRIILLNGAAKLAAQEGKCLESLKKLEASGIDILVCGACLTFYDLMASKAVGDTTNMLDVITSLDLADKVIRP